MTTRRGFLVAGGLGLVGLTVLGTRAIEDGLDDPHAVKRSAALEALGLKGDGKGDDTAALKRALERAGDTLLLPKGTFRVTEPITIDRTLSIRGQGIGQTIIRHDIARAASTISVNAPGVRLARLSIDTSRAVMSTSSYGLLVRSERFVGSGLAVTGGPGTIFSRAPHSTWRGCHSGIWLYGSTDCLVERCLVAGTRNDVRVVLATGGSDRAVIRANRFSNTVPSGAEIAGDPAAGIRIQESADCHVLDNYLHETNWYGIQVASAPRTIVRDNRVVSPGRRRSDRGPTVTGIHLVAAPASRVVGNATSDCGGYGVAVAATASDPTAPTIVRANMVDGCEDPGMTVQGSTFVEVTANRVSRATYGFTVGEEGPPCSHVTVSGNRFESCPWAGGYVRGSRDCAVEANRFTGCGDNPGIVNRPDAVIILYDGPGGRGTQGTRVVGNLASSAPAPAVAPMRSVRPRRFVAVGAPKLPARNSRSNVISGNRFV